MSSFSGIDELGELVLFIQEKMQLFDSQVDTAEGSTFYNAVIAPLIDRLGPDAYNTPLREFIIARLKGQYPDLVLQDGEPLDDYAVKIMQVLLEPFRRQIQQVSNGQSLADPTILNEREADKLVANYFEGRRQGGYSIGIARLYYSAPQAILITPNNIVYDGGGQKFIPVENQAITSSNMLFNVEGSFYYQDIVCRAELQGKSYNIEPNTLVGIEGASSVVKVVNKARFDEGDDKETTEAFVTRVENSLTEKSLVTFRGINARLFDVFTNIRLIQVIGHGDPEMLRDILTGAVDTPAPYAFFLGNTGGGGDTISLTTPTAAILEVSSATIKDTFTQIGARVGDKIRYVDVGTATLSEHEITATFPGSLTVTPDVPGGITGGNFHIYESAPGITVSGIPGGILDPSTPSGEVRIANNEVHLGGMLDVFTRAGAPQLRDATLEGILDGNPLRFGVDLETFGDDDNTFVQITPALIGRVLRPSNDRFNVTPVTNHLLVQSRVEVSPGWVSAPWIPTEQDVGRYIQILNTGRQALLKITAILSQEYTTLSGVLTEVVRLTIEESAPGSAVNYETPAIPYTLGASSTFDTDIRIVEEVSVKSRVRDRDGSRVADAVPSPTIPTGADLVALGAKIGDSVVLETGSDAGIYSIRRLLSWLDSNDTAILDRALTKTIQPSGIGDGSGVRYRIADELNVDLVSPQVVKIPLGTVFLGDDLLVVAGSNIATSGGATNFLLAGVSIGDTLEILEGDNKGKYSITAVSGTTLTLGSAAKNTQSAVQFTVYKAFTGVERPLVRVKDVELLDSNSQPTGIKIPYGDYIDARAAGVFSNRAEGTTFESYTGITQDNGVGQYDLRDPEIDFTDEGVIAGHRLNILSSVNAGEYTIIAVGSGDGLADNNTLRVALSSNGGLEFGELVGDIHYTVGLPSTGVVRLYFQEPTSVEIDTGLSGGRLQFENQGAVRGFRFSEVSGYPIVPAAGSGETTTRDLRVTKIDKVSGSDFNTVLELTGVDRPNVYELEIQEGDILEINEPLPFRTVKELSATYNWVTGNTTILTASTLEVKVGYYIKLGLTGQYFRVVTINAGVSVVIENPEALTIPTGSGTSYVCMTLREAGVFGSPAGLKTVAGSNLVEIPSNSLIDFQAMAAIYPLVGQVLYIDTGLDVGQYVVESVVSSKKLRLNQVMSSTTETWIGQEQVLSARDAQLIASGSPLGSKTDLLDSTDAGGIGTTEDEYITLFESNRGDLEGTYKITQYVSAGRVQLDVSFTEPGSAYADIDPRSIGPFTWLHTRLNTNVWQEFRIYRDASTQVSVLSVGTKRPDVLPDVYRGAVIASTVRLTAAGVFVGVTAGDQVEVLTGPNRGVYPIATVDGSFNYVEIVNNALHLFPTVMSDIPFRVWSGLHGSLRMLTVEKFESSNGRIELGEQIPYRVLRPKVFRLSSTDMETNFDGLFYYADLQVESQGSGDEFNLAESARLTVESGLRADGYTYTVDNDPPVLTFSPYEKVHLNFDRRFLPLGNSDSPENLSEVSGRNLKISYESSTVTRLVHDIMTSETDRPLNANPLARHFLPSYVFVRLVYRGGVSADIAGADIENYINGLGAMSELEVSDLEAFISRRGAESIDHPILLATITHDLDRKLVVNRTENRLGGALVVPYNGTGRISCFFAKLGEGLTVEKQS